MGGDSTDTPMQFVDAVPSSDQSVDKTTAATVEPSDNHCAFPPPLSSHLPASPALEPLASATADSSKDAMNVSPEPVSPDTSAATSTFSSLRLSPQRPSTPRSPARGTPPSKKKKHRKHSSSNSNKNNDNHNEINSEVTTATPTQEQQQPQPHSQPTRQQPPSLSTTEDILSLVDPIYYQPTQTSHPHTTHTTHTADTDSSRGKVGWDRVVVYRFPLTADASKVPGDSRSYYSVGLDYAAGEEREEWRMEEWETRRGKERNKRGCPELTSEERQEVWLGAQEKLKEDAEQKDDKETRSHETESTHHDSSTIDKAQSNSTATQPDDTALQPTPAHTHNLRKRQPPPSPALSATHPSAKSHPSPPPPLLFSDVSELTFLRSSRARVGCSCTVPAGDRQTKVCSAPWLQQSKRSVHRHRTDSENGTTAAAHSTADVSGGGADDEREETDYMAGHDVEGVVCECLLAGVGCNSNTCACFSYCCRNPYERYLFNSGKVNAKRRKMLASMKEMKAKGVAVVAADGEPSSGTGGVKGGKGKKRGRKRAQSV